MSLNVPKLCVKNGQRRDKSRQIKSSFYRPKRNEAETQWMQQKVIQFSKAQNP